MTEHSNRETLRSLREAMPGLMTEHSNRETLRSIRDAMLELMTCPREDAKRWAESVDRSAVVLERLQDILNEVNS